MMKRIATGIALGVLFYIAIWFGGIFYVALMLVFALMGFYEFSRLNGMKWNDSTVLFGYVAVFGLVFPWSLVTEQSIFSPLSLVWMVMFLFMVVTVMTKNRTYLDRIALSFIGVVYIGIGFHFMTKTRMLEQDGFFWTMLLFGCIWISDTGALFAGRWFGKRRLWASISPNKTIEGAIGGWLASVGLAVVCAWVVPEAPLQFGQALLLGTVVAVVGQMGDLIQSAYKRVRHVKDTGNLFPGHGGVLDRTDSWMIVFPFVHMIGLWF